MTVRIGVMTSGGDAQGMNAAVRAIVRAGIHEGAEVYAIREGWHGAISGGDYITHMSWSDVSGILNKGGTVIGTARSAEFRTPEGRKRAVANLIERGIDRLIVIGGELIVGRSRDIRLVLRTSALPAAAMIGVASIIAISPSARPIDWA